MDDIATVQQQILNLTKNVSNIDLIFNASIVALDTQFNNIQDELRVMNEGTSKENSVLQDSIASLQGSIDIIENASNQKQVDDLQVQEQVFKGNISTLQKDMSASYVLLNTELSGVKKNVSLISNEG